MKKILIMLLFALPLASCNGWFFRPSEYNPPTPFRPPTRTPSIVSPTPGVIVTGSPTPIPITPTFTFTPPVITPSYTPFTLPTETPTVTMTVLVAVLSVGVEVLGCNTAIDITHGMGEVSNAYVTLTNTGNLDLTNVKATLYALDEGREHPDKTVEIPLIPIAQEVTIKLTVDSTYQAETPIQVEVTGDGGLFQRVGQDSCRDLGLFGPDPGRLNTPIPVNP